MKKILLLGLFGVCIMCMAKVTVHASIYLEECKVRIFIDHELVDTLKVKNGEVLSLTNNYKGIHVRSWEYTIQDYSGGTAKRCWAIDEKVDITITGNDDILGSTAVNEVDLWFGDDNDKENINDETDTSKVPVDDTSDKENVNIEIAPSKVPVDDTSDKENVNTEIAPSKVPVVYSSNSGDNNINTWTNSNKEVKKIKKLSSPCILKCEKGSKKIVVKGEKETCIYIKIRKRIVSVYMNKKTKKTITLSKKIKKGEKIKIYAKKTGYKKSKVRIYKVK